MPIQEECSKYIKLLKDTEELNQEMRYLAAESFKEGWLQCELELKAKGLLNALPR